MRAVIKRDLADASIKGLSEDRRFATAYNAALQIAKMAIACGGYRLATTPGHHRLTLDAARLALGSSSAHSLDYFESCLLGLALHRKGKLVTLDSSITSLLPVKNPARDSITLI